MSEPFHVLCVCVGNVCRSPVAERLLQRHAVELPLEIDVASAGVRALVGREMTRESREELRRRDVTPDAFVARRFSTMLASNADLILTATSGVRRTVLEEAPAALRRTFTWKEFAALVDGQAAESRPALVVDAAGRRASVAHLELDTDDPIGRSAEVYARVAAEIDEAVTTIARALASCGAP